MAIIPKGSEPANIKKRIDTLFPKLDEAYPDKVIRGLQKDHKKWAETVTELYRALGYSSGAEFLEAYGYTVEKGKAGRSVTNDYMVVIEELKRRYPSGSGLVSVTELKNANPDLAGKFKSLSNIAPQEFGMPLGEYLVSIGVLLDKKELQKKRREEQELHEAQQKAELDELIRTLRDRYTGEEPVPRTIAQLEKKNSDLNLDLLDRTKRVYGVFAPEYLTSLGLISKVSVSVDIPDVRVRF